MLPEKVRLGYTDHFCYYKLRYPALHGYSSYAILDYKATPIKRLVCGRQVMLILKFLNEISYYYDSMNLTV